MLLPVACGIVVYKLQNGFEFYWQTTSSKKHVEFKNTFHNLKLRIRTVVKVTEFQVFDIFENEVALFVVWFHIPTFSLKVYTVFVDATKD